MNPINIIPNGYTFTSDVLNIPNTNSQITEDSYKYGTYLITASSTNNLQHAYYAFNQTKDSYWESGKPMKDDSKYPYKHFAFTNDEPATYVGGGSASNTWKTRVQGQDLSGEWIQIQAPYKLYLDNYSLSSHKIYDNSLTCGNTYSGNVYAGNTVTCGNIEVPQNIPETLKNNCPKQFYLLGSNDGNSWNIIDQRNLSKYPMDLDKATTYYVNTRQGYTHFRLVINEIFKGDNIKLYQFNLYGYLNAISGKVHTIENFTNYESSIKNNNPNIYMQHYKPFSSFEPLYNSFSIVESFDVGTIATYGNNINLQLNSLSDLNDGVNTNYNYLKTNITTYNTMVDALNKDVKYDFSGNVLLYTDKKPTLADGLDDDLKSMILQENNLYILGTITMATLLVGILVISRD